MCITEAIAWRDRQYLICIGFDDGGLAREAFLNGFRTGSDAEALAIDACILVSQLLQRGVPPAYLRDRLARPQETDPATGRIEPSLIALIVAAAAELEATAAEAVRAAYAAAGRAD